MGKHGASGQGHWGYGVHFDRGVYVCFFKVVVEYRGDCFFGYSSSVHVRVPSPMMREEKRWRPVQEGNCPGGCFWFTVDW
uniref:Uncharacterized protein n=1 Tax=Arundo donax TaxID=35708 RepID=A0A0A9F2Z7_ARUDO